MAAFAALAAPAPQDEAAGHEDHADYEAEEDEVVPSVVAPEIVPSIWHVIPLPLFAFFGFFLGFLLRGETGFLLRNSIKLTSVRQQAFRVTRVVPGNGWHPPFHSEVTIVAKTGIRTKADIRRISVAARSIHAETVAPIQVVVQLALNVADAVGWVPPRS